MKEDLKKKLKNRNQKHKKKNKKMRILNKLTIMLMAINVFLEFQVNAI